MEYKNETTFWGKELKEYNSCKRLRDTMIFEEIKNWETEHYRDLGIEEKKGYLNHLKKENLQSHKDFVALRPSPTNKMRRWVSSSVVEQTQWRINYLNDIE